MDKNVSTVQCAVSGVKCCLQDRVGVDGVVDSKGDDGNKFCCRHSKVRVAQVKTRRNFFQKVSRLFLMKKYHILHNMGLVDATGTKCA